MTKVRKYPLVIYDQDCGFCIKWIHKIKKILINHVEFKGYNDVKHEFQEITLDQFKKSLKYIDTNGQMSEAGAAVCQLLNHTSSPLKIVSWLYRFMPGYKTLFEWGYRLIANNRSFFSKILS